MEERYMKKKTILTIVCCVMVMCSCGSVKTETSSGKAAASPAAVIPEDGITTDGETAEGIAIPPRETFAEIPEEAELSFDRVVSTIDRTFPKAKKSVKRYYGYLGEQTVDGTPAYLFAIYDSNEGINVQVATAAVTADNNRVYALDPDSTQFWLLEQYQTGKSLADHSWTVTTTVTEEITTADE